MKQQRGFSIVELLLVVGVVALIGGVGWYAYQQRNKKDDKTSTPSTSQNQTTEPVKQVENKEYRNERVKLRFTYPGNWTLEEKIGDFEGGDAAKVAVTSPDGLKLNIDPRSAGRGGTCNEMATDKPHNTQSCSTIEVLSKEKVALQSNYADEKDVYLFRVKHTPGKEVSSPQGTHYGVFLSNLPFLITQKVNDPLISAWPEMSGTVHYDGAPYSLDTYISGVDLSKQSVLETADVKVAETILRSVQAGQQF